MMFYRLWAVNNDPPSLFKFEIPKIHTYGDVG